MKTRPALQGTGAESSWKSFGTCAPSTEDIISTIRLKKLLGELGIMVLDHLITTPEGQTYSFAQHGDI